MVRSGEVSSHPHINDPQHVDDREFEKEKHMQGRQDSHLISS